MRGVNKGMGEIRCEGAKDGKKVRGALKIKGEGEMQDREGDEK